LNKHLHLQSFNDDTQHKKILTLFFPVNTRNYNIASLELISEMNTSPARGTVNDMELHAQTLQA
jgi:hypothetical protein